MTDRAICRQGKKCKETPRGFPNQGERYGAKYENLVAHILSYTVSVEKLWTQNTCIIHDVSRLLILSNEEKRKILKKGGRRKRYPWPIHLCFTSGIYLQLHATNLSITLH